MQFTPQQLAGGLRYGSKTRIGNWHEDVVLEEEDEVKDLVQGCRKLGLSAHAWLHARMR